MVTFRSILSISGNAGGVVKIRNIRQRCGNPVKTFLLHIPVDGHRPRRSLSRTSLNDRGFGDAGSPATGPPHPPSACH